MEKLSWIHENSLNSDQMPCVMVSNQGPLCFHIINLLMKNEKGHCLSNSLDSEQKPVVPVLWPEHNM